MKVISLKLEREFLKAVEEIMKKHNYMTKTEFIREAIREKMKKLDGKDAVKEKETGKREDSVRGFPSYI
mgnify:CR=1 FL=1